MQSYLNLLGRIVKEGTEKPSARSNMPKTIGVSHGIIEHDLVDGFPLLTTKKMYLKAIIVELLWFLKGDTNIKYLVDNGCNIWNKDAYRWFLKFNPASTWGLPEFIEAIKNGNQNPLNSREYTLGNLGKVYGHQWRNQNGVDQIKDIIDGINTNAFSRYHILDGWNKADFPEMALPPCHLLYQFISRADDFGRGVLDLNMYQRSCDTFLGVPFNVASMSLLLMIIAKVTKMKPGRILWVGGDVHIYETHFKQVHEQIQRSCYKLPTLEITKELNTLEDIENLAYGDLRLTNYRYHPAIKAELSVGL